MHRPAGRSGGGASRHVGRHTSIRLGEPGCAYASEFSIPLLEGFTQAGGKFMEQYRGGSVQAATQAALFRSRGEGQATLNVFAALERFTVDPKASPQRTCQRMADELKGAWASVELFDEPEAPRSCVLLLGRKGADGDLLQQWMVATPLENGIAASAFSSGDDPLLKQACIDVSTGIRPYRWGAWWGRDPRVQDATAWAAPGLDVAPRAEASDRERATINARGFSWTPATGLRARPFEYYDNSTSVVLIASDGLEVVDDRGQLKARIFGRDQPADDADDMDVACKRIGQQLQAAHEAKGIELSMRPLDVDGQAVCVGRMLLPSGKVRHHVFMPVGRQTGIDCNEELDAADEAPLSPSCRAIVAGVRERPASMSQGRGFSVEHPDGWLGAGREVLQPLLRENRLLAEAVVLHNPSSGDTVIVERLSDATPIIDSGDKCRAHGLEVGDVPPKEGESPSTFLTMKLSKEPSRFICLNIGVDTAEGAPDQLFAEVRLEVLSDKRTPYRITCRGAGQRPAGETIDACLLAARQVLPNDDELYWHIHWEALNRPALGPETAPATP